MKSITLDQQLLTACPQLQLGCLFYETQVEKKNENFWSQYLNPEIEKLAQSLSLEEIPQLPEIVAARAGYKKLGQDPSRYRVSSESLLRRIVQGKGLYQINSVVDFNNHLSITTNCSVGSYDLSKITGEITFRVGETGETYLGIGKDLIKMENLPVFADAQGIYGSPTSDSQRAMITLNSTQILTVIIDFSGSQQMEKWLTTATKILKNSLQINGEISSQII